MARAHNLSLGTLDKRAKGNIRIRLSITDKDIHKLKYDIRLANQVILDAAKVSMYRFGVRVMRKSKKYTPVDTGLLRKFAYVQKPMTYANSASLSIGYGDVAYAIEVHERLDYFHSVGQAKFFERAVNEFKNDYIPFIRRNIRPMIRSGKVPEIKLVSDLKSAAIRSNASYTYRYSYESYGRGSTSRYAERLYQLDRVKKRGLLGGKIKKGE